MKTLSCDNCNTSFNVHESRDLVRCPGCRCIVHAKPGTPSFGTEPGDSDMTWEDAEKATLGIR